MKAEKRYQCDACAAEMAYDASTQQLRCRFCGFGKSVPVESGEVREYDLLDGLAARPRGLGATTTRSALCQECGANVVFTALATATRCTFCGSARVLQQSENLSALRPESLLPFAVDHKTANRHFSKWLGRLWFRPSDLQRLATVDEVHGVYVPFWSFDADVASRWSAEAGHYYYTEEEYTIQQHGNGQDKPRKTRHTRWERAHGKRSDHYDDLLVCASKGLPSELAARLQTFDVNQLQLYSPGFLAGFSAEEYAVDLRGGFDAAKARMEQSQERRCAGDVPGDTRRNLRTAHTFSSVKFKHVLLPVWIAAYRYRGRVYRFLVNGQTGEVVGKTPWSWLKIALFSLALIAVGLLLYFLFGKNPPQH